MELSEEFENIMRAMFGKEQHETNKLFLGFANVGPSIKEYKTKYEFDELQLRYYLEGVKQGAKIFINKIGLKYKRAIYKTPENLVKLLVDIGIVSRIDEGEKIIPFLNKSHITIKERYFSTKSLRFNKVRNQSGEIKYKISYEKMPYRSHFDGI